MNICVVVKHVPDSAANITILNDQRIDENITFLLNPFDEHALTEAARVRQQFPGSQVIAVCLGKPDAEKTIRSAMSMGADSGVLIETEKEHDSMITARLLKAAIDKLGPADLIFTGKESIDAEGMQTMFRIGALFDYPVANNVVRLEILRGKVIADTEFSGGIKNSYELTMPCVIGAGRGLNTPQYPTFREVRLSKKRPLEILQAEDLNVCLADKKMQIMHLQPFVPERRPKEIRGDHTAMAQRVVDILSNEAKVI